MDGELKQKILKYADPAYAAAYHTSLQETAQRIAATTNSLASRGAILSGRTILEIAKIQGDHINTCVQAKADALLDGYELNKAQNTPRFGLSYTRFMAVAADNWTLIAPLISPYLPALSEMLNKALGG